MKRKRFKFDGRCRLSKQRSANAKPRAEILAYTGKKIQVEGYDYPVVIDVAGVKTAKAKPPLIMDHEPSQWFGYVDQFEPDTKDGVIRCGASLISKRRQAQEFIEASKAGMEFQASVGLDPKKMSFVRAGDSIKVNNRTINGPLYLIKEGELFELTVCVLGADNDTKSIALKKSLKTPSKDSQMTFAAFVKAKGYSLKALDPKKRKLLRAKYQAQYGEKDPPAPAPKAPTKQHTDVKSSKPKTQKVRASIDLNDLREARASEIERQDAIRAVFDQYEDSLPEEFEIKKRKLTASQYKAEALRSDMTPDQVELSLVRLSRSNPVTNGPAIQVMDKSVEQDALVASILRTYGMVDQDVNKSTGKRYGLQAMFSDKVLDASHQRQYQDAGSIQAIFDCQIRASGKLYHGLNRNTSEFIEATHSAYTEMRHRRVRASGFSSFDLAYVFENVMNKSMLASFTATEGVWSEFCGVMNVKDFRPAYMYRLDLSGSYRKVANDGELKHLSMTDAKKSIQAETYGAMIGIDRKTLIDDDMGEIVKKANGIGMLAAQRLEESVFALLLANTGSFFSAGNTNLITGGSSALSLTALETARLSFRNKVVNGKPIRVVPDRMLVPPTLENTANRIYNEDRLQWVGGNTTNAREFTNNEFVKKYRPIVSEYLSNTSITDESGAALSGQSNTQWYLFGNPNLPQGAAINVAFLNGRRIPFFDAADTQFNIPNGVQMRSYHDWGVAFCEERVGFKSAGA